MMKKLIFIFCFVGILQLSNAFSGNNFWKLSNGPFGRSEVFALFVAHNNDLLVGTDESLFLFSIENGWKEIGSGLETNSSVRALLVTEEGEIFAGLESDGLYRSKDGGETWTKLSSLPANNVFSLIDNPEGVIFAGSGNSSVFRSTNNGESWTNLGLNQIRCFAFTSNGDLLVGTYYSLYRSSDNGDNWTEINTGLPANPGVRALAVNANADIFAGTEVAGVFHSVDGGNTWIQTGLTKTIITSLAISKGQIFAGVNDFSGNAGGVYRSSDNGDTWMKVSSGLPETPEVNSVVADSNGFVFTGMYGGVFRSTDDGNSWTQFGVPNSFIVGLGVSTSGVIFAGEGKNGVFKSTDRGNTWVHAGITYDTHALALNDSGHIFYGTELHGVFRSTDNGETWGKLDARFEDQTPWYIAVHPNQDVYIGTVSGVVRSTDNGDTWTQTSLRNDIISLAINSQGHIYAGGWRDGVFRSLDNGVTWMQTNLRNIRVWALATDLDGNIFAGSV